jgi:histidinol-phosphatase (PHP family)
MYLVDYHVHTDISEDSTASMRSMVDAEAAAGVRVMCFTNHCDLVRWQDDQPNPRCRVITEESASQLAALRAEGELPIEVRVGLELAEGHRDAALAAALAADARLDFVLGSLHILPGYGDLYWQHYTTCAQCERLFDLYLDELQHVAELDFYDVLAHLGYGRRYMCRDGVDAALTLERFGGKIERLLRTVIDKGRGLEVNCSGLRDGCGPFPSEEILLLYRSLGGETVTLGSDAHSPGDAAKGLTQGVEVLRRCGFDRVAVFRGRKPDYIDITREG